MLGLAFTALHSSHCRIQNSRGINSLACYGVAVTPPSLLKAQLLHQLLKNRWGTPEPPPPPPLLPLFCLFAVVTVSIKFGRILVLLFYFLLSLLPLLFLFPLHMVIKMKYAFSPSLDRYAARPNPHPRVNTSLGGLRSCTLLCKNRVRIKPKRIKMASS